MTEGNGGVVTATFTVTVSTATHPGITFDIATVDGTGAAAATVADGDYVPQALTSATLATGATTFAFDVTINGDTSVEPTETFSVVLSAVTGATLADGTALGTIVNDDDPPPVVSDVVISQVYGGGGNSGAPLKNDYIELFNRGSSAISLDGWSVQYNAANQTTAWQVTPLTGTIAPNTYYLIQEAAGTGVAPPLPTPDASGTIAVGSTAGKVALVATTTPITGACPANAIDIVGYGATNCFEGTGSAPTLSNTTAALRVHGGCADANDNSADFVSGNPSPRNSLLGARSCIPIDAAIHDIQGDGAISTFVGQEVQTSGVVTGAKSNGFFLQAPDALADNNPATSEGIFVFTRRPPAVAIGNVATVRSTVSEFFGLTQLESPLIADVTVTAASAELPSPVELTTAILDPAGTPEQMERFEGMRLHAASLTSVAPTNEFGEIATVLTGVPRPFREPGISVLDPVPPDPTTGAIDCCIPRFDENPERIVIDSDGLAGAPVLVVTSNVVIGSVAGPLDFAFGAYKILPQAPPAAGANMSGVAVRAPLADEFTVAGFNIENFAGNDVRKKKAALAIRQLMRSPDVIGHIEILDQSTLQGLADQVNADAVAASEPDPGYQAVLIPTPIAGATQNVGFLVKTSRVRIDAVTQERAADTFIDPATGQAALLHDRPPLVLRVTVEPSGPNPHQAILVVNHLRSFIDIELVGGDGPRVRAKRKAQAESVAGLLQELQTQNPQLPVIAVGDYNAYQFSDGYTDPIATLKGLPTLDDELVVDASPDLVEPNFVNLVETLPAAERYSFIFEGTPQVLDHVLVNSVAASYAQGMAIARGNADFPAQEGSFAGDATRPERSSDHDMPVAYFRFPPPSADLRVTVTASGTTVTAGQQVSYAIMVTNAGDATASAISVTDTLPLGLTLVSCEAPDGVCGGSASVPTATFDSLAPGESRTVTVIAVAGCGVANGATLENAAMVSAATLDPELSNNSAAVTVMAINAVPTIENVTQSRTRLPLPLYQMVPVTIGYNASDTCGAVTTKLIVTSDEPVTGSVLQQGLAALTSPDWQVVNDHTVRLRAERALFGDGRVYTIRIESTDAGGGVTTRNLIVTVP